MKHIIRLSFCMLNMVSFCIVAFELPSLVSQLDQLAQSSKQQEKQTAIIKVIDWSKVPCITYDINILAPANTSHRHHSIFYPQSESSCGVPVEIVQPIVVWQEFLCEDLISTNIETAQKLLEDGFETKNHAEFLQIFRKNFIALETLRTQLLKIPTGQLGGGQGSCGYHALAHAQTIVNYLIAAGESTLSNLLNFKYINDLFGFSNIHHIFNPTSSIIDGSWRLKIKTILEDPTGQSLRTSLPKKFSENITGFEDPIAFPNGDWLSNYGISVLIHHITSQTKYPKEVHWFAEFHHTTEVTFHLQSTFSIPGTPPAVSIIICHADALSSKKANKQAHWFSVVISKSIDRMQIIILDSKNIPRFDHQYVKKIITSATGISSASLNKRLDKSPKDEKTFKTMQGIADLARTRRSNITTLANLNKIKIENKEPKISLHQWYEGGPLNLLPITKVKELPSIILIRELLLRDGHEKNIVQYFKSIGLPQPSATDLQEGKRAFVTETGQKL